MDCDTLDGREQTPRSLGIVAVDRVMLQKTVLSAAGDDGVPGCAGACHPSCRVDMLTGWCWKRFSGSGSQQMSRSLDLVIYR